MAHIHAEIVSLCFFETLSMISQKVFYRLAWNFPQIFSISVVITFARIIQKFAFLLFFSPSYIYKKRVENPESHNLFIFTYFFFYLLSVIAVFKRNPVVFFISNNRKSLYITYSIDMQFLRDLSDNGIWFRQFSSFLNKKSTHVIESSINKPC